MCVSPLSLVTRMMFRGFPFSLLYMFTLATLDLCMSLARLGLAGITFALGEIMVGIDTFREYCVQTKYYTGFHDDTSRSVEIGLHPIHLNASSLA